MARNGSQRLLTAPYDYKHTLLLFSSSMTPTDFQRLPLRELTPQPNSQELDHRLAMRLPLQVSRHAEVTI